MLAMLSQKMEVNSALLRPFLMAHIKTAAGGKWGWCLEATNLTGRGKKWAVSRSWIRHRLGQLGQSYKRTTNDPGKLPLEWKVRVPCTAPLLPICLCYLNSCLSVRLPFCLSVCLHAGAS